MKRNKDQSIFVFVEKATKFADKIHKPQKKIKNRRLKKYAMQ